MPITITQAATPEDIAQVRELFLEYAAWLGFSLCFQGFDQELAALPGKYALPAGRLLLVRSDTALAGCGAMRPLESGVCEMKRVYLRPDFRGHGLGRKIVEHLIAEARAAGYQRMRLDTHPQQMAEAHRLYLALGFYEIPAYYDNPRPDVCYLELKLG